MPSKADDLKDLETWTRRKWRDYEKKYTGQALDYPKKEGDPPWTVGVQVGLDGTGLKVKRFFPLLLLSRNETETT